MSVLNPAIRMYWINKHWETKYLKRAEEMILTTVSLC